MATDGVCLGGGRNGSASVALYPPTGSEAPPASFKLDAQSIVATSVRLVPLCPALPIRVRLTSIRHKVGFSADGKLLFVSTGAPAKEIAPTQDPNDTNGGGMGAGNAMGGNTGSNGGSGAGPGGDSGSG